MRNNETREGAGGGDERAGKYDTPSRRNVLAGTALGLALAAGIPGIAAGSNGDEGGEEPAGESLTPEELGAFVEAFDDEPIRNDDDIQTPQHVWKWINEDVFLLLHVDEPDPAEANMLEYVGIGVTGVFCSEDQPPRNGEPPEDSDAESEFTHFHRAEAESWEAGHGGQAGDEGYWLVHLAVNEFEYPWGTVTPGIDYEFMPTPAPDCEDAPEVDFAPEGAEDLAGDELQELLAMFDDEPMTGGQETPGHVWKWINEDVFLFLEVDEADVEAATAIEYVGIGIRGQFTAADQPHPDFTHFHRAEAESWDEAHGGDEGDDGYWLIHVAADEFERPWGAVTPGVDRAYAPTPPPDADAEADGDESADVTDVELVRTDDSDQPFAFEPNELEISAGDTVRWTNTHSVFHTVTSTDTLEEKTPNTTFDESLPDEGATFEFTFDEAGTYHYYCKPHAGFMEGTVRVE